MENNSLNNKIRDINKVPSIDLYYKYMKYLTSRMTLVNFTIDSQALNYLRQ